MQLNEDKSTVDVAQLTLQKLRQTAHDCATGSPLISGVCMSEANELKAKLNHQDDKSVMSCQHCGTMYRPGNHTVRLLPRMRLNKKVEKLLCREKSHHKLGRMQQKLVNMYVNSRNRQVIACHFCEKHTVIPCQSRLERTKQCQEQIKAKAEMLAKPKSKKAIKKAKKKLKAAQEDSGLELSLLSPLVVSTATDSAFVTPDRLTSTPYSSSFSSTKSFTPKTPISSPAQRLSFHQHNSSTSSGSSSTALPSSGGRGRKEAKKKKKAGHELLHLKAALAAGKKSEGNGGGSLQSFLSAL